MQPTPWKRLRRSIPALIGWFFATFWALLAAFALPHPYDRGGCALAFALALIFLTRTLRSHASAAEARGFFRAPAYLLAVSAELLGMYTAALLLPRIGGQQQVYPAVGCIVGLHFIGLWLATGSSRFLRITAGMCCVSLCSMLAPFLWRTIGLRHLLLGAGNATVLWIAASGRNGSTDVPPGT